MRILSFIRRLALLGVLGRALVAYLDPGSGSIIVQVIIAAIVGLLATFRLWKSRLLALLGIRQKSDDDEADSENDSA